MLFCDFEYSITVPEEQPVTREEAIAHTEGLLNSRLAEIDAWRQYGVFHETHMRDIPDGTKILDTRWVDTLKIVNGSRRPKSRLCVKGCQEDKTRCPSTFAPTANKETIMMALHMAAANQWTMKAMDVEKAFLQSAEIERKVYVYPPEEADLPVNVIWKLLRPAYGLNDAARGWHRTLRQTLLNLGMRESEFDKALFIHRTENRVNGTIVAHVDDLLVAGNDRFYETIGELKKFIKMGKEAANSFKFCGMNIYVSRNNEITVGVDIDRTDIIKKLTTVPNNMKSSSTRRKRRPSDRE